MFLVVCVFWIDTTRSYESAILFMNKSRRRHDDVDQQEWVRHLRPHLSRESCVFIITSSMWIHWGIILVFRVMEDISIVHHDNIYAFSFDRIFVCEYVTTHIHWVTRGTGTPKNRDEVNKREVCECDGWVWDLDTTGAPSIFKTIRNASFSEDVAHFRFELWWDGCVVIVELVTVMLRKLNPWDCKERSVSRWARENRRHTISQCNLPDVLTTASIKEITLGGLSL